MATSVGPSHPTRLISDDSLTSGSPSNPSMENQDPKSMEAGHRSIERKGTFQSTRNPDEDSEYDSDDEDHGAAILARRSSSLGVSLMSEYPGSLQTTPVLSRPTASISSNVQGRLPPYRPLVGAGPAAAFEALRHDFYVQKQRAQQRRRMSSLSLGSTRVLNGGRPVNAEE